MDGRGLHLFSNFPSDSSAQLGKCVKSPRLSNGYIVQWEQLNCYVALLKMPLIVRVHTQIAYHRTLWLVQSSAVGVMRSSV
jgi:hypothetical protein